LESNFKANIRDACRNIRHQEDRYVSEASSEHDVWHNIRVLASESDICIKGLHQDLGIAIRIVRPPSNPIPGFSEGNPIILFDEK
jgi:hypothetical protein